MLSSSDGEMGNISLNLLYEGSASDKNWTQSDLRFCKNDGLKRSKTNAKWAQLEMKS